MTRTLPTDVIVSLSGFIEAETEKAILFEVHNVREESVGDTRKEWFPISQVRRIVRQPKNSQEMDTLVVSEWIASKKGLV